MIKSAFSRGERVKVAFDPAEGRTKQSMRDECNINLIMARYQRTGAVSHVNRRGAEYGFAPALDFRQAMELTRKAQAIFDELPSSLRKRFRNDPAQFLEFVQNPENAEEMRELGLMREVEKPTRVEVVNLPVPEPPDPPGEDDPA